MALESIDPSTGERIAAYEEHGRREIDTRLARAVATCQTWRERDLAERTAALRRVADVLDRRREEYARLITREMGKPITDARAEVAKCAAGCRHYAEHGAAMLANEPVATEAAASYVAFDPI